MIGDFRLRSRLGAGGMGRVYLGFSPAGRAVAVKVIHPHLARDPSFAARFRREVTAAQAVNAIYATPVVAAGPDDVPPWLATAFVPAPTLSDVVAKNGPRLIDFGIARVMDGTRLTSTDNVLGTPSYMSPEQAQGQPVGPPSDVFSLGGVVHFAVTGQPPFGTGGGAAALLYRIVFGEPQLDPLPPRLRPLVAACLDKNPAARPTPAQLAAALLPAMPGDEITPSGLAFWPQ
ncbi:MAG TPA: serine/threonine-protein kinase, partial [Trebonia sp.]|nr:serine/threonine-protein kinase [Trebonia sp.]